MDNLLANFAGMQDLGWGLRVFIVVVITLILRFIAVKIVDAAGKQASRTRNYWDDALLEAARPSLGWYILILGLCWAAAVSNAYIETPLFSEGNLDLVRRLSAVVLMGFFLVRFINLVEKRMMKDIMAAGPDWEGALDATTLTALAKLFRLAVVISAVLVALPTLGLDITALLAAGGVGGIAIGFAAKDMLANFFGGLMIYLDRPFVIGDWIRSPDRNIEGTVENIGWRLTLVRTFDKRPLYVPNSVFTNIALENPSRMLNRRIKENIGIRYKDAAKIGVIVKDVKEMLENHPDIDSKQTLMVNFNSYAASSLEFFIYTFTKTVVWTEYHEVKQDVLLKIVEIVHRHGADFAFPTTTVDGLEPLIEQMGEQMGEQRSEKAGEKSGKQATATPKLRRQETT